MRNYNWKDNIVQMVMIKAEMQKYDSSKLWEYHLPNVSVEEREIINFESKKSLLLNEQYKNYLKHSNGWSHFYQTVSLFGINELNDSEIMSYANNQLDILEEEGVLKQSNLLRGEIIPIAATFEDLDIFVITKESAKNPGVVVWFAGEEVDRFENFGEFFLSMVEYNRLGIEDLKLHN